MEISPGDEPPCEIFDSETLGEKRQRAVHEILTMGIQERINTQPNVTLYQRKGSVTTSGGCQVTSGHKVLQQ